MNSNKARPFPHHLPQPARPVKAWLLYVAILLTLAGAGLAVRVAYLGNRPMHADEAVQAAIFRKFWWDGQYRYNPEEFHGPTLPYATAPAMGIARPARFAETTAAHFRIVPVVFGAAAVVLVWLLHDGLGKAASLVAAGLLAFAPAAVFYSRYYIHETPLAFFTLAAVAAGWRYARTGRPAWCVACGACLGLMQATKETAALAFVAMAGALAGVWWCRRRRPNGVNEPQPGPICRRHLALGASAAVLVWATLISSFYTNPRGLLDGLLTYGPWLGRAGPASPHVQPWHYYLCLLAGWGNADGPGLSQCVVLLLAAVGLAVAVAPWPSPAGADRRFLRWLAGYTVLLTAAYSVIPYKTPWCVLSMLHGVGLLAAVGAAAAVRAMPGMVLRGLLGVALLAAGGHLAWQSYQTSFVGQADPGNPYVYVQTLPDAERLGEMLEQLAAAVPAGEEPVKVVWHDGYYWPLPWYLRRFERVGYWTELPPDPSAPLVLASPAFDEALAAQLGASHLMTGYYGLRPNVLLQLWVRDDVWEAHLRRQGRL